MSASPRLSVGLPVYNGEKYIDQSIESLLGQTYEDFELIISDNASTDSTADICRRYGKQDSRIRYIRQPRKIGLFPNHNFVVQRARGEYFKWAAADDPYGRDLLKSRVNTLDQDAGVVLAHSWEVVIDDAGTVTQARDYPLASDSPRAPERFKSILSGTSGLFESSDPGGSRPYPGGQQRYPAGLRHVRRHRDRRRAEGDTTRQLSSPGRDSHLRARPVRPIPHDPRLAVLPARHPGQDLQRSPETARSLRDPRPVAEELAAAPDRPPAGRVFVGLHRSDPARAALTGGPAGVLPQPDLVDIGPGDQQGRHRHLVPLEVPDQSHTVSVRAVVAGQDQKLVRSAGDQGAAVVTSPQCMTGSCPLWPSATPPSTRP